MFRIYAFYQGCLILLLLYFFLYSKSEETTYVDNFLSPPWILAIFVHYTVI